MRHLDIDALATYVAVIDANSFTRAAARLGRTQAAVSMAMGRFEERLGTPILERSRNGARPTAAGETLLAYARRILALEDEALTALAPSGAVAAVRVGMPDDYLEAIGIPLLKRFNDLERSLRIEIVGDFSGQLERKVERGELDVAVITREPGSGAGEFLREEALVWCASPDRFPELLDPLPLALFPNGCRARPRILEALDRTNRPWTVAWTSTHISSVLAAIRHSGAITALPEDAVPSDLRRIADTARLPALDPVELALISIQDAPAPVRKVKTFLRGQLAMATPTA